MSGGSSYSHRGHILDADVTSLLAMAKEDDLHSASGGHSPHTQTSRATSRASFNPRLHEVPRSIDEIRFECFNSVIPLFVLIKLSFFFLDRTFPLLEKTSTL